MKIECNGYTLEVKNTFGKSPARWVIEATLGNEKRYRGFYYKKDAISDMNTWTNYESALMFSRNFYHNFEESDLYK